MSGRAKKNAQREKRKMEKRSQKAARQAGYLAKVDAGVNAISRTKRLQRQRKTNRTVANFKGEPQAQHADPYRKVIYQGTVMPAEEVDVVKEFGWEIYAPVAAGNASLLTERRAVE